MRPQESFVGQPVRSLQTMLRVIAARHTDLPSVIPDGIYGQQTMRAVSAFQQKFGLSVTGITDQGTWEMISSVYQPALIHVTSAEPLNIILEPNQVIRSGEEHHSIYLVQAMLTAMARDYGSIPEPPLSGILDSGTGESLIAFQQLSGLDITGELDKVTWKHLVLQFQLSAVTPVYNPNGQHLQAK